MILDVMLYLLDVILDMILDMVLDCRHDPIQYDPIHDPIQVIQLQVIQVIQIY